MIITIQDIRDAGFCVDGIRRWCRANDIDFRDLRNNGMDADEFEKIDAHAKSVVDRKKATLTDG